MDNWRGVKDTIVLKNIPNTGLKEAAMKAIKKTRFKPAKQRPGYACAGYPFRSTFA
ncbi:MAG: hypothetical protein IIA61_12325 [Candidatus Marinimicrobia bacterium]|nr:hypothetical protein [Candidatus Neomarinimicrobiota bacterium]